MCILQGEGPSKHPVPNIVKHRLHVCSKVNTALQFLLIAVSLGAPVLGLQHHPSLHYLWAATGATTFLSAVSYAFMKVG